MLLRVELIKGLSLGELAVSVSLLIVVLFLAKFISIRLKRFFKDKLNKAQLNFMLKFSYYGVILLYVFFILTYFGVNLSGLMVAGGIAGIVIGFASQRIVGNLISGLFLFIERPIGIGSDVNLEGIGGFVEDIRVLSTIIRTYDGLYVRIPNEKVFMSNITNNVAYLARRVEFSIGIDFNADIEFATNLLKEVAENHSMVLVNPHPEIYFDRFSESSAIIIIRLWSPINQWWHMRKEIFYQMKKALNENNIVIPYPNSIVWLNDPDR